MSTVQKRIAVMLTWAGLILSSYLMIHHYQIRYGSGQESVCNINEVFNCDAVALHPSSEILGVPVAGLGVLFYILILALTIPSPKAESRQRCASYLSLILTAGLLFDLYLFLVSALIIKAFCPFCALTYLINLTLFGFQVRFGRGLNAWLERLKYVLADWGWGTP